MCKKVLELIDKVTRENIRSDVLHFSAENTHISTEIRDIQDRIDTSFLCWPMMKVDKYYGLWM